jgi:hypothetical protein
LDELFGDPRKFWALSALVVLLLIGTLRRQGLTHPALWCLPQSVVLIGGALYTTWATVAMLSGLSDEAMAFVGVAGRRSCELLLIGLTLSVVVGALVALVGPPGSRWSALGSSVVAVVLTAAVGEERRRFVAFNAGALAEVVQSLKVGWTDTLLAAAALTWLSVAVLGLVRSRDRAELIAAMWMAALWAACAWGVTFPQRAVTARLMELASQATFAGAVSAEADLPLLTELWRPQAIHAPLDATMASVEQTLTDEPRRGYVTLHVPEWSGLPPRWAFLGYRALVLEWVESTDTLGDAVILGAETNLGGLVEACLEAPQTNRVCRVWASPTHQP